MPSDSILWIPSRIFFAWISRRLAELTGTLVNLASLRPLNHGLLASLILHLIRHIMVSPPVLHTYMNEMLRDIQFRSTIGAFGMFFLHDLDSDQLTLPEIPVEDTVELKALYKNALRPNKSAVTKRYTVAPDLRTSTQYPWGKAVSWTRLKSLLSEEPTAFIRHWKMNDAWGLELGGVAARHFVAFTRGIWLGVCDTFLAAPLLPYPYTLEEAMDAWSVSEVVRLLGTDRAMLLPSTWSLKGNLPKNLKRDVPFSASRKTFFPPRGSVNPKSHFSVHARSGYIGDYYRLLDSENPESIQIFHDQLDSIFQHVQCLPSTQGVGSIWGSNTGRVQFISNSDFYRIEAVDQGIRPEKKLTRPQTSLKMLEARVIKDRQGLSLGDTLRELRKPRAKEKRKSKLVPSMHLDDQEISDAITDSSDNPPETNASVEINGSESSE